MPAVDWACQHGKLHHPEAGEVGAYQRHLDGFSILFSCFFKRIDSEKSDLYQLPEIS